MHPLFAIFTAGTNISFYVEDGNTHGLDLLLSEISIGQEKFGMPLA